MRVDAEARPRVDDLRPGLEQRLARGEQDLDAPVPDRDPVRTAPRTVPERLAQPRVARVGIAVQPGQRPLDRLDDLRQRRVGRLVAGQHRDVVGKRVAPGGRIERDTADAGGELDRHGADSRRGSTGGVAGGGEAAAPTSGSAIRGGGRATPRGPRARGSDRSRRRRRHAETRRHRRRPGPAGREARWSAASPAAARPATAWPAAAGRHRPEAGPAPRPAPPAVPRRRGAEDPRCRAGDVRAVVEAPHVALGQVPLVGDVETTTAVLAERRQPPSGHRARTARRRARRARRPSGSRPCRSRRGRNGRTAVGTLSSRTM